MYFYYFDENYVLEFKSSKSYDKTHPNVFYLVYGTNIGGAELLLASICIKFRYGGNSFTSDISYSN